MLQKTSMLVGSLTLLTAFCAPNCLHGSAQGETVYVGTCNAGKAGDYGTIGDAAYSVSPGSIINVCPGTYPEHVSINKPLTIRGVQSNDNANVVITGSTDYMGTINAQVEVNGGGPVNLSGIVIDGTNAPAPSNILFTNTSGVINNVSLKSAQSSGISVSGTSTVTIENSQIQIPAGGSGIFSNDEMSNLNISRNFIYLLRACSCSPNGIYAFAADLKVIGNKILIDSSSGVSSTGINASSENDTILDNDISGAVSGIFLFGGNYDIERNQISNAAVGVQVSDIGSLVLKNNTVVSTNPGNTGFNLRCQYPSPLAISGNTFIGLQTAVTEVAQGLSFPQGLGTYTGVQSIEQVCFF